MPVPFPEGSRARGSQTKNLELNISDTWNFPNIPLTQNLLRILALMALPNASVRQIGCLSGQSRFFSQEGAHEYNLKDGKLQD